MAKQDASRQGEELERLLILRTSPLAIKLLTDEAEIPEGTIRPRRQLGHLSQCQALAMSRRQKLTVAMLAEDHWCWAPLIGYGLVDQAPAERLQATKDQVAILPRLERGRYIGLISAPLRSASFPPDVVIIYGNVAQLRSLLMVIKYQSKIPVRPKLDPINSCVYSVVTPMITSECSIAIPCAGEQQRAMPGEDEIIFSLPYHRLSNLISGLEKAEKSKAGYAYIGFEMRPDFPRPEFYRELFSMWGLETEK